MANYEATKYNFSGADLTGIEGIPTATIVPWSDSSVPTGFLECAGAAVSRSTYSALFAIIGTTYGAGNGSTTFTLPNLADNVAIGKSNNKALASTGGANTVAATGNIGGTTANASLSVAQLAAHSHNMNVGGRSMAQNQLDQDLPGQAPENKETNQTGSGSAHQHNMSANFSGDSTSVLQPYLTVLYVIKT